MSRVFLLLDGGYEGFVHARRCQGSCRFSTLRQRAAASRALLLQAAGRADCATPDLHALAITIRTVGVTDCKWSKPREAGLFLRCWHASQLGSRPNRVLNMTYGILGIEDRQGSARSTAHTRANDLTKSRLGVMLCMHPYAGLEGTGRREIRAPSTGRRRPLTALLELGCLLVCNWFLQGSRAGRGTAKKSRGRPIGARRGRRRGSADGLRPVPAWAGFSGARWCLRWCLQLAPAGSWLGGSCGLRRARVASAWSAGAGQPQATATGGLERRGRFLAVAGCWVAVPSMRRSRGAMTPGMAS